MWSGGCFRLTSRRIDGTLGRHLLAGPSASYFVTGSRTYEDFPRAVRTESIVRRTSSSLVLQFTTLTLIARIPFHKVDEKKASPEALIAGITELVLVSWSASVALGRESNGELVALATYMGGDFDEINGALRDFDEHWEWVPEHLRHKVRFETFRLEVELVVSALNKLPNFRGIVRRVVELHGSDIGKYRVGKTITEPAFISTTHKGIEPYPGNVEFEIVSKTGKRVSFLNESSGEDEVLFKPATKFNVLKEEKRNDDDGEHWIIKMEEQ